ncbi:hypothetical protein D3C72_2312690 [compost metagenome]
MLEALEQRGWIDRNLDSRALSVTRKGAKQFPAFFGPAEEQPAAHAASWPRKDKHAAA